MRQACLVIVALAVAIATTFVPIHRAAKAMSSLPPMAGDELLAMTPGGGADNASVPAKRCQSGAGLLACPFTKPSVAVTAHASVPARIRFEFDETVLTGRSHPAMSRPPKALSA